MNSKLLHCLIFLLHHIQGDLHKCPEGEFPCGDLPECVDQRFQCDGLVHCANKADEFNCTDPYGSYDKLFPTLKKAPNNDSWKKSFDSCVIPTYLAPQRCGCVRRTVIICDQVRLDSIPIDFTEGKLVTQLSLVGNSLRRITPEEFAHLGNLTKLYISDNLHSLQPGTFVNLTKLQYLKLPLNNLTTLKLKTFQGLENLLELEVNNNKLHDFDLNVFMDVPDISRLNLNGNFLQLKKKSFPPLRQLNELDVSNNQIKEIHPKTFGELTSLRVLTMRHNLITYIDADSFANLGSLNQLDLAYNQLTTLHARTFHGLSNLTKLILDYNPIKTFPYNIFHPCAKHLRSLHLAGIEIKNLNVSLFTPLKQLQFIYFKKFHYCSYARHVRSCEPKSDGVSTVDNLLGRPILRLSVWMVGAFTCLGNMVVLWGRMISREENKILSLFIRNLAAADFMMGIYLFVIGAHDLVYRDQYNHNALNWMSSWRCTLSGALAMTSTEASVLILCYMSLERFVCIVCPFGNQYLGMKSAIYSLAVIWIVGLILAFIPIFQWQNAQKNAFYGTNGMCFPLHIDDPFLLGWEYSAFIFLGVNGLGVLVIVAVYTAMFISIKRTRRNTPLAIMDTEFAFRFFCIVLTDCICWIPIIILKIAALYSANISADFYAWVVVFILPINSALNPILYTFTTSKFRSRVKNFCWIQPKMKWIGHVQRKDSADTDSTSSSKRSHHKSGSLDVGRDNPPVYTCNCPAITDVINGNANHHYKSKFYLGSIETCI